ncbi:MAG: cupin domain-containing protein [Deinococcus sp.]|nr:cupin domain-containing protein [Deinococcus sp.]
MAIVRATTKEYRRASSVSKFLTQHDVDFRQWDIDPVEKIVRGKTALSDSEKSEVLSTYSREIEALKRQNHYVTADVVVLSPQTPNLENLLAMFRKEHYHSEDEVRFIIDGSGVFTIRGKDERLFDVEVSPGDMIVVPARTWHWFDLKPDRTIKAVRLFQTTAGWTPIYRDAKPN